MTESEFDTSHDNIERSLEGGNQLTKSSNANFQGPYELQANAIIQLLDLA
jgi:hypothetical protein